MAELLRGENIAAAGYAVALLFLVFMTVVLVINLVRQIGRGDLPRLDSHWGGFGGGLGGWQISPSLMYLVASIAFAILTVTTLGRAAADLRPNRPVSNPPATQGANTSGGQTTSPPAG